MIRIVFQFELSALTGSAIWSGHHAARIQSTFAIPAARYLCDLSLRTDDLDLVGRPDKHVIGRAMAAMAALEADPVSVGAGWRNLGIVQSCDRTLRSWRADSTRIRAVYLSFLYARCRASYLPG